MVGEGRQRPWLRDAGQSGSRGRRCVVESWTVVARGYHVASRASRAKFGYRTRVERPVRAHERAHRELVEDHEDDGGVRRDAERRRPRRRRPRAEPSPRTRRARSRAARGRARGTSERPRTGCTRPRRARPGSSAGAARPRARGRGTGRAGAPRGTRSSRSRRRAARPRPTATARARTASTVTTTSGGTNASSSGEHDHVRPGRATDDEELRVAAEHREHRLAHAVSPQRGEMREPPPVRRKRHERGVAWYSARVPEGSSTELTISNRARKHCLEGAARVVGMRALALPCQESLDHHVVAVGELDDELAAERRRTSRRAPAGESCG